MRTALILGITGQDGSYLAEFLLAKGYEVHGMIRRASTFNTDRMDSIYADPHEEVALRLHYGDMSDGTGLRRVLEKVQPDEVYNLAAQSHVRVSFDLPEYTADVVATGTLRAARSHARPPAAPESGRAFTRPAPRKCSARRQPPQNETTPFPSAQPLRACSKVCGLLVCRQLPRSLRPARLQRNSLQPRIARAAARPSSPARSPARSAASLGLQKKLYLGNLDAKRDWGYAGDYVEAMWLMLQQDKPDDYVIATGETHSVREFLDLAGSHSGIDWTRQVQEFADGMGFARGDDVIVRVSACSISHIAST